ncbi:hypothetical protein ACVME8_006368 [Bradyrhizobium diazoefficiens]|jgi:hypothetical protein
MSTRALACADAWIVELQQATGSIDLLTEKNLHRSREFDGFMSCPRSLAVPARGVAGKMAMSIE